jgi:hypothetical protein
MMPLPRATVAACLGEGLVALGPLMTLVGELPNTNVDVAAKPMTTSTAEIESASLLFMLVEPSSGQFDFDKSSRSYASGQQW